MKAAVVERAGGPEALQVREVERPEPREGWALVRIEAFGLNRSEMFTRQGHSPSVRFPRILGIECVGVVEEVAPGAALRPGTTVASVMNGMGREYDGSYAEYALLPERQLMPVQTSLPWETLGALPETYLTARGSLDAMGASAGKTLLIRAATSSVGMAALQVARAMGLTVAATTRSEHKREALVEHGADHVVLDRGDLEEQVGGIFPGGADGVLDLVGGEAVLESLRLARRGGTVCNTGILSGSWVIERFEPLAAIPSGTKLTAYSSEAIDGDSDAPLLREVVSQVEAGSYRPNVDRIFALDEIVEAHRYMEENRATGKIVVIPTHEP
jgi:NADPH:quinone reductase-like Zn-dependent oxidoreductase